MASIEKLLIYDATRSRATAHVFIGHPSPAEERTLGKLGLVAEISGNDRINQELFSRLQEFVKTAYYTSPEAHAALAFEHTVQAANRYLSELVSDFGAGWVDRFSMVLFALRDGEVHFADVGQLIGFLFHDKQVTELFGAQQRTGRVNPLKMFTSIASGSIKGQDAIVFATANLLDYFSVDKLRRTVVEMPLGGAARQLELTLRQDATQAAFAAVILQNQVVPAANLAFEPVRQTTMSGAPQRSMDTMLAQTAQTQALLTPSLWPALKRGVKRITRQTVVVFRAWILRKPTRVSPALERQMAEEELERPGGTNVVSPRSRYVGNSQTGVLKRIPAFLWQRGRAALRATPQLVARLQSLTQRLRRVPRELPSIVEERVSNVRGLPQRSRLYFYGAVVLAGLFALALIGVGIQRNRSAATKVNQAAITTIEQKVEQASSSVIYGDEDRARTLLKEAQAGIAALPNKSKADKDTRQRLTTAVEGGLAQTRHIVSTAPTRLGAFAAEVQPVGLTLLGRSLYTADAKTNALVAMAVADGATRSVATMPGDPGMQALTSLGSGTLIALAANLDIVEQRTTGQTGTRLTFTTPNPSANLVGFASYNTAVYSIDIASSSIIRATKQAGKYVGAAWLKQSTDLATTADFTVDGSIYTLGSAGAIQKFTQGRRAQFVVSPIDPALTTAAKLVGGTTLQHLYILDTVGKRIAVFTKSGSFVNQYVHDNLQSVTAFAVDEGTQKIYVLVGNDVQTLTIEKVK